MINVVKLLDFLNYTMYSVLCLIILSRQVYDMMFFSNLLKMGAEIRPH